MRRSSHARAGSTAWSRPLSSSVWGFDDSAIARRVAKGWLCRVHRGVYLVGALETALTRPAAALQATGPDAALSHRTAAVIWELLPPRPADPIHITLLSMPTADPVTASRSTTPAPSRPDGAAG